MGNQPIDADQRYMHMSQNWKNKTVLVTGGSSGFGKIIAEAFGQVGARVAIMGLEEDVTRSAAEEIKALGVETLAITGNVTEEGDTLQAAEETAKHFGSIDVLVNCAGRTHRGWILETPSEEIMSLFRLNLLGTVQMTRAALPFLLKSGSPSVVNIGSLAAKSASRWVGAYPITKFAVAAFSQQLRLEMRDKGLHVLLVCPGPIKRNNPRLYPLKDTAGIPNSALLPGAGVKVGKIDPAWLARKIIRCCEKKSPELVVPGKARILFSLAQMFPRLGDWLVLKNT